MWFPPPKKKLYRILPFLHTTQQIDLDYTFFLQVFIHHQPSSSRSLSCVFAEVSVVQAHPDNPDQMVVTVGLFVAGSAFPSWAAAHLAQMVPGLTPSRFWGWRRRSRYLVIATSHDELRKWNLLFSGKTAVGEIYFHLARYIEVSGWFVFKGGIEKPNSCWLLHQG